MSETPPLPIAGAGPLVTAAVTSPPAPASPLDLTPGQLAKLAREVVMNIRDLTAVLNDFNLTKQQYDDHIKTNPFFKQALETLAIEWNSADSTHKRLKIEAAALLEETLPTIGARMVKTDEPLREVVEGAKMLARVAGVDGEKQAQGTDGKFIISIDIGQGTVKYEKDITPTTPSAEEVPAIQKGQGSAAPVPKVIEGKTSEGEVQPVPEGKSKI